MLKKLVCIILSAMMVMAMPVMIVSANEENVIVFNEKGFYETEVKAGETVFTMYTEKQSSCYLTLDELEGSNIELVQIYEYYKGIYSENKYSLSPDVYGCYQVINEDSKIVITVNCTKDTTFKILKIDGYIVKKTDDLEETIRTTVLPSLKDNEAAIQKDETVKICYKSNNSKQSVKMIYGDQVVDSFDLKAGEEKQFSLDVEGYKFTYTMKGLLDANPRFDCERMRNYLVESGTDFSVPFPNSNDNPQAKSCNFVHKMGIKYDYDPVTVKISNVTNSRMINMSIFCHDSKYTSADVEAKAAVFVKTDPGSNILTLDKEEEIYCPFEFEEFENVCYSFTPDKDGIYTCTSRSGDENNPYVAVFDANDKCIGWYDNKINKVECKDNNEYERRIAAEGVDYQLNLKIDLKAGQTYYFYFMNPADYVSSITHGSPKDYFTVKLTYEPYPPKPDPVQPDHTITPEPATGGGFEEFVERLYTVALNRPSEPEGKAFWCEHVGNGDLNGAQCANEFLLSKEFKDRKLSDEDFLKVLYKTFFDRDAANDPDGFNFWMNSLKTEGRDKVVDGFINSTEWCNICASYGVKSGATRAKATIASKNATAFATRLYTECLGRDPETDGLNFWSLGLTNLELTGKQAAHEFFFSKEFNDFNLDNEGLLTRMYKTFMGREPDTDGMNFWLNNMKNGMTKEDVFNEFVKSAEFTQICKDYAIDRG